MVRTHMSRLVVTAVLAHASLSAAAEDSLDGTAIKALFSDTKTTATTSRGHDFTGRYDANGTMKGSVADGKYTDSGTWLVEGDRFCRTWSKWSNGTKNCFEIIDLGGGEYRSVQGGGQGSTTFRVHELD